MKKIPGKRGNFPVFGQFLAISRQADVPAAWEAIAAIQHTVLSPELYINSECAASNWARPDFSVYVIVLKGKQYSACLLAVDSGLPKHRKKAARKQLIISHSSKKLVYKRYFQPVVYEMVARWLELRNSILTADSSLPKYRKKTARKQLTISHSSKIQNFVHNRPLVPEMGARWQGPRQNIEESCKKAAQNITRQ